MAARISPPLSPPQSPLPPFPQRTGGKCCAAIAILAGNGGKYFVSIYFLFSYPGEKGRERSAAVEATRIYMLGEGEKGRGNRGMWCVCNLVGKERRGRRRPWPNE